MFKAFTQRDWAIFTQTYGQPLRLGKYGAGASENDRETLFRAVANIAGDCGAIIPDSMAIDFVETKSIGSSTEHYERRADWLDKQISKAVLGQTATTDAVTGGLGSGKEHREVQEDIERADAKALSAILNRDLVRPWVDLEWGPQERYPRIVIARPEQEDLAKFSSALAPLVNVGLRVRQSEVRERFGLADPDENDEILTPNPSQPPIEPADSDENRPRSAVKYPFNGQVGDAAPDAALQTERRSQGRSGASAISSAYADRMATEGSGPMGRVFDQIEAMLATSADLSDFRHRVMTAYPDLDLSALSEMMAEALLAGHAAGRAAASEDQRD